ncbi:circumsporozoite protein [Elysia marginata]|uniref:Circumsporozoite protein n=1 Tax=Elysia marginata TaxID=1093978 RepID=A0AAV4HH14_9GAST|nr:circumsporozoite protein [Elysia marginata]
MEPEKPSVTRQKDKPIILENSGVFENAKAVSAPGDAQTQTRAVISAIKSRRGKSQGIDRCFYCDAISTDMTSHLTSKHPAEPEVARLMPLHQSSSKLERKEFLLEIQKLTNLGNFVHSVNRLEHRRSKRVLCKPSVLGKPSTTHRSVLEYLPCTFCYKFYEQKDLHAHVKEHGESGFEADQVVSLGRTLLKSARLSVRGEDWSVEVKESALPYLAKNDVQKLVQNDSLILRLAAVLHKRLESWRARDLQQKIKQLGQLVLVLQKTTSTKKCLENFLTGDCFEDVVKTAKNFFGSTVDTDHRGEEIPAFSLKVGYLLAEVVNVLKGQALQSGNRPCLREAENFLNRLLGKPQSQSRAGSSDDTGGQVSRYTRANRVVHSDMSPGAGTEDGTASCSDVLQCVEDDDGDVETNYVDISSDDGQDEETLNVNTKGAKRPTRQDKKYYCFFCEFSSFNIERHYMTVHAREPEVLKLIEESKSNQEAFSRGIRKLGFVGNFLHNVKVHQGTAYNFVACNSPIKIKRLSDYIPCLHCYGFYAQNKLCEHIRNCEFRAGNEHAKFTDNVSLCRTLLESACLSGAEGYWLAKLNKSIVKHITARDAFHALSKDKLILLFGATVFKSAHARSGVDQPQVLAIAKQMVQLGKLLLALQEKSESGLSLERYVSRERFDEVLQAVRKMYSQNDGEEQDSISAPQFSIKMGQMLGMVGNVKRGWALASGLKADWLDAEGFLERLHSKEWDALFVSAASRPETPTEDSVTAIRESLTSETPTEDSVTEVQGSLTSETPTEDSVAEVQESLTSGRVDGKDSSIDRASANNKRPVKPKVITKRQYCLYCNTSSLGISRHLFRRHLKEPEVARLVSLKQSKATSSNILQEEKKLRCLGNFLHNIKVLQGKELNLVVARRSSGDHAVSNYLPCFFCLEFFSKANFHRHSEQCHSWRDFKHSQFHRVSLSRLLLQTACLADNEEEWLPRTKESLLRKITKQTVYEVIVKDMLIMRYGASNLKQSDKSKITQNMVLLGKMVVLLRKSCPEQKHLTSFISDEHFDQVLKVAQELRGIIDTNTSSAKSLSVQTGFLLAAVAHVKRGWALKSRNNDDLANAENFLKQLQGKEAGALFKKPAKKKARTGHAVKTSTGGSRGTSKTARSGHNPMTGEVTVIDAVRKTSFLKPGRRNHYCPFCGIPGQHNVRHIMRKHSREPEASRLKALSQLKENREEYLREVYRLRCLGSFLHNVEVLHGKKSNLAVAGQTRDNKCRHRVLPCVHCFEFFKKSSLCQHEKQCPIRGSRGFILLNVGHNLNEALLHSACLSDDKEGEWVPQVKTSVLVKIGTRVSKVVEKDMLIMRYGASFFERCDAAKDTLLLSQEMSQLGKLVSVLEKASDSEKGLTSFITGGHFEDTVKAAQEICGTACTGSEETLSSSTEPLDLKIGRLLAVVAVVKQGHALMCRNKQDLQDVKDFLHCLQNKMLCNFAQPDHTQAACLSETGEAGPEADPACHDDETKVTPEVSARPHNKGNGVTVPVTVLRKSRIRLTDKRNCCLVCGIPFKGIVKHLLEAHSTDPRVSELQQLRESDTEEAFENEAYKLTCLGNFIRNVKILRKGGSCILAVKRSTGSKASGHLPCLYCYGFFGQSYMLTHIKSCRLKSMPEHKKFGGQLSFSKFLLESACLWNNKDDWLQELRQAVLTRITRTDVFDVVAQDELILRVGVSAYRIFGEEKVGEISKDLTQLGTLLLALRKHSKTEEGLNSFICKSSFHMVAKVARKPYATSLSYHMGYLLCVVGNVKRGWALQGGGMQDLSDAEGFLELVTCKQSGALFTRTTQLAPQRNRRYNPRTKTAAPSNPGTVTMDGGVEDGSAGLKDVTCEQTIEGPHYSGHAAVKMTQGQSESNDKKNYCMYCQLPFCQIVRHMIRCHAHQPGVSLLISLRQCGKLRDDFLRLNYRLRCFGNFLHNIKVLQGKESDFVFSRRSSKTAFDCLPCLYCFEFFSGSTLNRHMYVCPLRDLRDHKVCNRNLELNKALLKGACLSDKEQEETMLEVKEFVWPIIAKEDVFETIENDTLIVRCGALFFNESGKTKASEIAQKLTQLGKLLSILGKASPSEQNSLTSYISGSRAEEVIIAAEKLCAQALTENAEEVQACTLSIQLNFFEKVMKASDGLSKQTLIDVEEGAPKSEWLHFKMVQLLAVVGNMKRGWAVQCGDNQAFEDAELFLSCLQTKQSPPGSEQAGSTLVHSQSLRTGYTIPLQILDPIFSGPARIPDADPPQTDAISSSESEESDTEPEAPSGGGEAETDCLLDQDNVTTTEHTPVSVNDNKRLWSFGVRDKREYCMFCKASFFHLIRHMFRHHSREPRVARLMHLKRSPSTQTEFARESHRLRCLGNFSNNISMLQGKASSFVVMRRSARGRPLSDYLPCCFCFGFYSIQNLNSHMDRCLLNDGRDHQKFNKYHSFSKFLLEGARSSYKEERWMAKKRDEDMRIFISQNMGKSDVIEVVSNDRLLLRYAAALYKFKKTTVSKKLILKTLHEVGQLLSLLQKRFPAKKSLASYISSDSFYDVLEAAEKLAGVTTTEDGEQVVTSPMHLIKLGLSMALIGNMALGAALLSHSRSRQEKAENFLSRLLKEWPVAASSQAETDCPFVPRHQSSTKTLGLQVNVASLVESTPAAAVVVPGSNSLDSVHTSNPDASTASAECSLSVTRGATAIGSAVVVSSSSNESAQYTLASSDSMALSEGTVVSSNTHCPLSNTSIVASHVSESAVSSDTSTSVQCQQANTKVKSSNVEAVCLNTNTDSPLASTSSLMSSESVVGTCSNAGTNAETLSGSAVNVSLDLTTSSHHLFANMNAEASLKNAVSSNTLTNYDASCAYANSLASSESRVKCPSTGSNTHLYSNADSLAVGNSADACSDTTTNTECSFARENNEASVENTAAVSTDETASAHFSPARTNSLASNDSVGLCSDTTLNTEYPHAGSSIDLDVSSKNEKTTVFCSDTTPYTENRLSSVDELASIQSIELSDTSLNTQRPLASVIIEALTEILEPVCPNTVTNAQHPHGLSNATISSIERSDTPATENCSNENEDALVTENILSRSASPVPSSIYDDFLIVGTKIVPTLENRCSDSPSLMTESSTLVPSTSLSACPALANELLGETFPSALESTTNGISTNPAAAARDTETLVSASLLESTKSTSTNTVATGQGSESLSTDTPRVESHADKVIDASSSQSTGAKERKREPSGEPVGYCRRFMIEHTTKKSNPGITNTTQYCLFCKWPIKRIMKHLTTHHSKEPEIKELLSLKLSTSRNDEFLSGIYKMECMGNFLHNIKLLQGTGHGKFVIAVRRAEARPVSTFLPCLYCLGFHPDVRLESHMEKCAFRDTNERTDYYGKLALSKFLLASACLTARDGDWAAEVRSTILPHVAEHVSKIVAGDRLILRCGALLLKRLGTGHDCKIAEKLEKLGKLLHGLQETDPSRRYLQSFITGSSVPEVIKVCENLGGLVSTGGQTQRHTFRDPSFVKGLGFLLTMVGNIQRGWALQCRNKQSQKDAEAFISRLLTDTSEVVSLRANLGRVQLAKVENVLPDNEALPENQISTSDTVSSGANTDISLNFHLDTLPSGATTDTSSSGATGNTVLSDTIASTVSSGANTDIVSAGADTVIVSACANTDTDPSGANADTVSLGANTDTVSAGANRDIVSAGANTDTVSAVANTDIVLAGANTNIASVDANRDIVSAGANRDIVSAGANTDTVSAGTSTDTVSAGVNSDTTCSIPCIGIAPSGKVADTVSLEAITDTVFSGSTSGTANSGAPSIVPSSSSTAVPSSSGANIVPSSSGASITSSSSGASITSTSSDASIVPSSSGASIVPSSSDFLTDFALPPACKDSLSSAEVTGSSSDSTAAAAPLTTTSCDLLMVQPADAPANELQHKQNPVVASGAKSLGEVMGLVASGSNVDNVYACAGINAVSRSTTGAAGSSVSSDGSTGINTSTIVSTCISPVASTKVTSANESSTLASGITPSAESNQHAQSQINVDGTESLQSNAGANTGADAESTPNTPNVRPVSQAEPGRRRLSKYFCYFCKTIQNTRPHRHILRQHGQEPEIRKLLPLKETDPKAFAGGINRLKRLGSFEYNVELLRAGESDIIVVKKSFRSQRLVSDFVPCLSCYGMFPKNEIFVHHKCLNGGKGHFFKKKILNMFLRESAALQDMDERWETELRESVFPLITDSGMCSIAEKDRLIFRFGEVYMKIFGKRKAVHLADSIKRLVKLLLILEDADTSRKGLGCFLAPESFDRVKAAAEKLNGIKNSNRQRKTLESTFMGKRTIFLLALVAVVKRGLAFQCGLKQDLAEAENFFACLESKWSGLRSAGNKATTKLSLKLKSKQLPRKGVKESYAPPSTSSRVLRSRGRSKRKGRESDVNHNPEAEQPDSSLKRKRPVERNVDEACDSDLNHNPEAEEPGSSLKMKRKRHVLRNVDETCDSDPDYNPEAEESGNSRKRKRSTSDPSESEEEDAPAGLGKNKVRKRAPSERKRWTLQELSLVKQIFGEFLKGDFYPTGRALKEVIEQNPCLEGRTVAQMRSKLQHLKREALDS